MENFIAKPEELNKKIKIKKKFVKLNGEKKEKSAVIKKIKESLKIAGISILAGITIGASAGKIYAENRTKNLSSNNQVNQIAEALDYDMSYWYKFGNSFYRMANNGEKPIYVCYDNKLTEQEKKCSQQAIAYWFDVVSKINDNYHYKEIDEKEYLKHPFETTIYFSFEHNTKGTECVGTTMQFKGRNFMIPMYSSYLTDKVSSQHYVIKYNRSLTREQTPNGEVDKLTDEELLYVSEHECLHMFGKKDTYRKKSNGIEYADYTTLISEPVGKKYMQASPSDLKGLISLYAKSMQGEELEKFTEKYKKEVEKYTAKYFLNEIKKFDEKSAFERDDFDMDASYEVGGSLSRVDLDGNVYTDNYKVLCENGMYNLKIMDKYGNLEDECSGKLACVDGSYVLLNVTTQKGLRPSCPDSAINENGMIADCFLIKSGEKYFLIDPFSGDEVWLKELNVQKSLNL